VELHSGEISGRREGWGEWGVEAAAPPGGWRVTVDTADNGCAAGGGRVWMVLGPAAVVPRCKQPSGPVGAGTAVPEVMLTASGSAEPCTSTYVRGDVAAYRRAYIRAGGALSR